MSLQVSLKLLIMKLNKLDNVFIVLFVDLHLYELLSLKSPTSLKKIYD